MAITDAYNRRIEDGDHLKGYTVRNRHSLTDLNSVYYELEHNATGAKHIHISRPDTENVFSVAFRTVPTDSTGVAHILEHTALCGSQKYGVRDPFFSMIKRSLNTFMNAFTASDWTMYPFSTQNRKDFYNLMAVYLDAAFFPRLDELSFRQEGHRLEFDKSGDGSAPELRYKGVVYNEMKGAMSSPRDILVRSLLGILYPDTTYHYNSGGDPAVIPSLTYADFLGFHRRHYHPSNAFFYTYGDMPLEEHLGFIQDSVLRSFDRIDPATMVMPQPRWQTPKSEVIYYPLEKDEDPSRKHQFCVSWLTADICDAFEVLALTLLERVLLGNAASPLRKALIESGLGSALSDGTGFDPDNRDTFFSFGLKDISEGSIEEAESLITDTLQKLVDDGIDNELIDAAIHQFEFQRKEVTNTPYPYGLQLLLSFAGPWLHGGDPRDTLEFNASLARVKTEIVRGGFFESRVKRYFLENAHRLSLTLAPDDTMAQREAGRVAKELDMIRSEMSEADIQETVSQSRALKALQDVEEDVSCLPTLGTSDIPRDINRVSEAEGFPEISATCYSQPTSGIFYFAAGVGAGHLPPELLPLVPFFCYAFPKSGTNLHTYEEMARAIEGHTGGLRLSAASRTDFMNPAESIPCISIHSKCLNRNESHMLQIVAEMMFEHSFRDLKRLKSLLMEYRAGLESMVVRSGHSLAMSLAGRAFSKASALNESWHGITQLKTIKAISSSLTDEALGSLSDDLHRIGTTLFGPGNVRMAIVGDDSSLAGAAGPMGGIEARVAQGGKESIAAEGYRESGFHAPQITIDNQLPREGWTTSSAVSFVASTFPTVKMDHIDAPALAVIGKMLRSLYIHREVREKGGAYGGYATYSSESGLFNFASYRDPHILSTLSAFDGAVTFIRSGGYTGDDVKEAILQTCSDIDRPDPPGPAAVKAFTRKLVSLTDDIRSRYKEGLLEQTKRTVRDAAEKYFVSMSDKAGIAVISGAEKLEAANKKIPDRPFVIHRI